MKRSIKPPLGITSLPDYWNVAKMKHIAAVRSSNVDKKTADGEQPVRLCNYVDVYYNDSITSSIDFMEATASPEEVRRFRLREGDVLVTKDSESWDDIAVPAYVTRDFDDVLCGYHLAQIRPRADRTNGRFLFYCLSSEAFNRQLQVSATGVTRFGLSIGALASALLPVPPLHEQTAIASFLDEKTSGIDNLIANKELLIGLIEAKQRALITEALTGGMNKEVPRRETGFRLLGSLPADWRVVRLKYLASGPFMYGANESADIDDPDLPRYIRITDLNPDGTLREDTFRSLPKDVAEPYMLADGDILFARSGATVGKAVRYRTDWGPACFAGYLIRMRPDTRLVLPGYVEFYTQSEAYRREVEISTVQATIQNVGAQRYGEFRVPLPSLREQEGIVQMLGEADRRARRLTAQLRDQIRVLQRYRRTIISAAVTGQMNVLGPKTEKVLP